MPLPHLRRPAQPPLSCLIKLGLKFKFWSIRFSKLQIQICGPEKIFIQLVVINWLLGFVYDHFLNKNVYACGYKIFSLVLRSQKYATRSLRSLLSYFYDLSNSRKYFIHHRHNILIYHYLQVRIAHCQ